MSQDLYNGLWRFMVACRTFLIRSRILRLHLGPYSLNSLLFRLGFLIVPPVNHDTVVTLPTGPQFFIPAGHSAGRLYVTGSYEPPVTSLFTALLRNGMTVVDAGAQIGYYTAIAAHLVGPDGHVYAFEPDPYTLPTLSYNVSLNHYDNVTIVDKAISDKVGTLRMWIERDAGGSNLYTPTGGPFAKRQEPIETTTLDAYFEQLNWPVVDIVKMDIEGSETAAFRTMIGLCQRNPALILIVEYAPRTVSYSSSGHEFFTALRHCGFTRFYMIEDNLRDITAMPIQWLERKTEFREANILCVRG